MKNKEKAKDSFYTTRGFSLLSVIVIIIITAFAAAITTGVIANNNAKSKDGISYKELLSDKQLSEFIDVYSSVLSDYYEDVNKDEMINVAISAMLNYLDDSYTTYMDTEQSNSLAEKLEGKYHGIGVTIYKNVIVSVLKDSPAEAAGLEAGDTIISINGKVVTDLSNEDISAIIKENISKDAVNLEINRNEETLTFEIKTANLLIPAIDYYMVDGTKIGYIYISIFSSTVAEQVSKAVKELESLGMEKLIIDVRDNTGGYLSQAESIASIFLKKDKLLYSLEQKDQTVAYYDKTDEYREYPIVVLINHESASASEILAAALKDSYGAYLVGESSYGKGKVQQTIKLQDQSMAKYTSAKWLRPNGDCIDGIGLLPDIAVELEIVKDDSGNIVTVNDTQLNKAIEILQ